MWVLARVSELVVVVVCEGVMPDCKVSEADCDTGCISGSYRDSYCGGGFVGSENYQVST